MKTFIVDDTVYITIVFNRFWLPYAFDMTIVFEHHEEIYSIPKGIFLLVQVWRHLIDPKVVMEK